MPTTIRLLGPADLDVLRHVAPEVFDGPVDARWSAEFLSDPRHHLVVAIDDDGQVVGMASAVHYVHPDKAPQLWVNEVGVAPSHQGRGLGKGLVQKLLDRARALGCTEAWVLTTPDNMVARRLYASAGGTEVADASIMFSFPLDAGSHPA